MIAGSNFPNGKKWPGNQQKTTSFSNWKSSGRGEERAIPSDGNIRDAQGKEKSYIFLSIQIILLQ